ncbi:MAG TPA: DUF5818 domain-containing protein [Verrucomicrobiae bacterium]|jgi:hypothetical protein|nr:DUF5818 domain-containing protein [Verrucomicrobiae bacterium]
MNKALLYAAGALLMFAATPRNALATAAPAALRQQTEQKTKMFSGTVVKSGDHFILSDAANKLSYVLDDAQKASQYEGKKVKVTGTVDVAGNTIHVQTIEEIA